MKKHITYREYSSSVKKLEKLTNDQLVTTDGGQTIDIRIIISPPGYIGLPSNINL